MNTSSAIEANASLAMPHSLGARVIVGLVPRQFRKLVLQLREDWRAHSLDWTLPGFRAIAVHRFGNWVQTESGRGIMRGPITYLGRRLHLAMFRYVRNRYGIELPLTAIVGRRVIIGHQSGIVIHTHATIGDDCLIRQNVTIGVLNSERAQAPIVGSRVEFGAGSSVLGAVTIGDGARIGPHSLVMTDVPPGAMVFVNPPRVVSPRGFAPSTEPPVQNARDSKSAAAAR